MIRDQFYRGKKLRTAAAVLLGVFILAALVLAAGRFWLISSYYNTATGYYDGAGISENVINYSVYGVAVAAAVCGLFFMKKTEITVPLHSAAGVFGGVFCGLTVAASFVITLIEQPFTGYGTLDILCLVLLLPAALYFILGVAVKLTYTPKVLLGFSIILWSAVNLLKLYFDLTYTINNPAKVSEQLLSISFMLFFLYECRAIIGKGRPAVQLAVGNIAIVLSFVSVIPNVLAYFLYGYRLTVNFASQIAELGILVYIIIRSAVTVQGISFKMPEVPAEKKAEKDEKEVKNDDSDK